MTPAPAHLFIPVQFQNLLEATASGVEIGAHVMPVRWWRLDGSYSTFHLTPHLSTASRDTASASFDGNAPRAQWQARSAFWIGRGVELDAMLFHAGELRSSMKKVKTATHCAVSRGSWVSRRSTASNGISPAR